MAALAIAYNPMTTILLSGSLAKKFGRTHRRQVDSQQAWEAFKALKATIEGFEDEIRRLDRIGMRFAIFRNRKNESTDAFGLGGTREIRIVPVISGSKRAGLMQTILGVVLIAVGFFAYGSTTAQGAALIAGGIASTAGGVIQMLSPQMGGLSHSASPENLPSYSFGSARNTTASGNPVPICIGERRWGGMIISASIYAEDKT
ncbi:tail assembly protein [Pseudomonas chlororaphis]|uniref:tail assembly protein n=1 Tax=Pseudomonas chlororaphis TaxID=587753 RepID=UPI00236811B0|nr:tail assembly protein [Pseudomonas chlororaphis]WDG77373.1 tail assembly protein [Pseudomonas chlororaphis]WDG83388.1 tail assembly protein [Pseudomonas chlororaphis]